MPATGIIARSFHTSIAPQSTALLVGGLSVAGVALAAKYAVQAWERRQGGASADTHTHTRTQTEERAGGSGDGSDAAGEAAPNASTSGDAATAAAEEAAAKAAAGSAAGGVFGAQAFARRFYKGGFEDKMTRREAALILGVRESAAVERVRDRHRKMLMNNHPDKGGSTYLAGKINEAKDLLLKGSSGR